MILLTKDLQRKLPPLLSQDGKGLDQIAIVKFFTPWGSWRWYASEYDPKSRTFFGLVNGWEKELGYWTLDELEEANEGGVLIERDLYFEPTPLRAFMQ